MGVAPSQVYGIFGGNGQIRADGGHGRTSLANGTDVIQSGGGGGGRIAVTYDMLLPETCVNFATATGLTWDHSQRGPARGPSHGTIHLSDTNLIHELLTGFHGKLIVPGFGFWSPETLVVSNAAVAFERDFLLTPVGDVTITGADSMLALGERSTLACGGDLSLTNGACLLVQGGPTNGLAEDVGASVDVSGTLRIATSSWVCVNTHDVNGGAPLFNLGRLHLQTGSAIDASARGFREFTGPGSALHYGDWCAGAGHGGKGGRGSKINLLEGGVYGRNRFPSLPGSGGGNWRSDGRVGARGGYGGGVIRLRVERDAVIDGRILARGGAGEHASGGGSGGSILLTCQQLRGASTARLDASGGEGSNWRTDLTSSGGGGGGGRIVVAIGMSAAELEALRLDAEIPRLTAYDMYPAFEGIMTTSPGNGAYNLPDDLGAAPGSATFLRVGPPAGSIFFVR